VFSFTGAGVATASISTAGSTKRNAVIKSAGLSALVELAAVVVSGAAVAFGFGFLSLFITANVVVFTNFTSFKAIGKSFIGWPPRFEAVLSASALAAGAAAA